MIPTDPGTIEDRACNGLDLDDFFPEAGDHETAAAAKKVCAGCPVVDLCLEWALYHEGGYGHAARAGYYGGMSPRQRAAEASRRRKEAGHQTATHERIQPTDVKECELCGTQVRRAKQNKERWAKLRFCSRQCHATSMVKEGLPEAKTCEFCNVLYVRGGRDYGKWSASRFCGVECAGKARRNARAA